MAESVSVSESGVSGVVDVIGGGPVKAPGIVGVGNGTLGVMVVMIGMAGRTALACSCVAFARAGRIDLSFVSTATFGA